MNKNIIRGNHWILRIGLFVAWALILPAYLSAGVIRVPEDYATIQQAVDAAFPGDTVFVGPGVYREAISLTKGLTLIGAGPDSTIINPTGKFHPKVYEHRAIYLNTDLYAQSAINGVTISGFHFTGDDPNDYYVAPIYIRGCPLKPVKNIIITRNRITNVGWGIQLRDNLENVLVANNEFENIQNWRAIDIVTYNSGSILKHVQVQCNVIRNSTTLPILLSNYALAGGIFDDVLVSGNLIQNVSGAFANPENWVAGVASRHGVSNLKIIDNVMSDLSGLAGISLVSGPKSYDGLVIERNSISGVSGSDRYPPTYPSTVAPAIRLNLIPVPAPHTIAYNSLSKNSFGLNWSGSVTLVAKNNYWGCSDGPGTTGCDPVLGLVDFTPWLTEGFAPTPTCPALEAWEIKSWSLEQIRDLIGSYDKQTDKQLEKAAVDLEKSLNPDWWTDLGHLSEKGKHVFDKERQAVNELMKLKSPPDVLAIVRAILTADRKLAQTAIEDAEAVVLAVSCNESSKEPGCKQTLKELEESRKEMCAAQAEIVKGDYEKAVEHYRKACEVYPIVKTEKWVQ